MLLGVPQRQIRTVRTIKKEVPFHLGVISHELFKDSARVPSRTFHPTGNQPSGIDADAQRGVGRALGGHEVKSMTFAV